MSSEITCRDVETGREFRANPVRDIAYFLPEIVMSIEEKLEEKYLPHTDLDRLKAAGVDPARLKLTFACLCRFFDNSINAEIKSPLASITEAGFFDEPLVCQDIVLSVFGRACLGACWAGLRSSVMDGECPPLISVLKNRASDLMSAFTIDRNGKPPGTP